MACLLKELAGRGEGGTTDKFVKAMVARKREADGDG